VKTKYAAKYNLFNHFLVTPTGTHYEISYINSGDQFATAYLRYIEADNVLTEDK
jgi:hypothetical protein